ncbi:hypothetical protein FO519_005949 [Halicephalobus sp. NKZ332]|nr:hypothetical protein FO519_005949 [Halicephalobus sp. NKZ332]
MFENFFGWGKPEEIIPSLIPETVDDGTDENPYVTFRLKIHLKEAHGLVIRDASGSSDPYVKFKYQDKTMYKSNTVYRSLNPNWDEEFAFLIDDPTSFLKLEVFDFDRFMMDDPMGFTNIDLSTLKLFEPHELKLTLEDEDSSDEYMGYVQLTITVTPLTEAQKNEFLSRSTRGVIAEVAKRSNKAVSVWLSAVNIVLVEARLNVFNFPNLPDPYVKFKLGSEKCKSKVQQKTFEPKWIEQYDLHIFDENFQNLDVMVRDKSSNLSIGKCSIDLRDFEREKTEEKWFQLEEDSGSILLLLTISGTAVSAGTVADLTDFVENRNDVVEKYGLRNSFVSLRDVGHLSVKVFRAEGLASADINGKSDPFCVLELVNARLQTHTEYKTLNPEWNKLFTFAVKDIHEVLEITVYDEDPNKKFFITFVYFIQLHHWPILLLLLFIRFHIYHKVSENIEIRFRNTVEDELKLSIDSDEEDYTNDQTEKSTGFIDRFQAVQDVLQIIQIQLDFLASLLERFRNTFNFTVPYLSYLAIVILCVAAVLLYFVPFRWIFMIWGRSLTIKITPVSTL